MGAPEWRPIPGIKNYLVSSDGQVARILSGGAYSNGYRTYTLTDSYRHTICRSAHQLVAAAFIGPRPEGLFVNHKDGNKGNNLVENLEYVTRDENTRHAVRLGLFRSGERHPAAKLTWPEVREIRALAGTESQAAIGRRFGVTQTVVSAIVRGETWKERTEA